MEGAKQVRRREGGDEVIGNGGRACRVWLGMVRTQAFTLGSKEPQKGSQQRGTDLTG